MQCLETAFELSPEDVEVLSVSKSLLDVFQEGVAGEIVHDGAAFIKQEADLPSEASTEAKMQAEKLKNDGNNLMKTEQFADALQCYSK